MFDPSQRSEALKQSNAIMRCFIGQFINTKINLLPLLSNISYGTDWDHGDYGFVASFKDTQNQNVTEAQVYRVQRSTEERSPEKSV